MRERNYGRIVLDVVSVRHLRKFSAKRTDGSAKAGMIWLMNVLHLEGAKNDIRINILSPTARTGMTEGLLLPGRRGAR